MTNQLTTAEKVSIINHAKEIYTSLPGKMPVIDTHSKGNKEVAERAINLAEYFHAALKERGYTIGEDK